ncbi:hypothetical protein ACMFMF_011909 [Clarireedia jacksonii]
MIGAGDEEWGARTCRLDGEPDWGIPKRDHQRAKDGGSRTVENGGPHGGSRRKGDDWAASRPEVIVWTRQ